MSYARFTDELYRAPLITRDDKIRFAADCIRSGIEVDRVARHLCVKPLTIYRWLGRKTKAQHDETGRIWIGPASMIPAGYHQTNDPNYEASHA